MPAMILRNVYMVFSYIFLDLDPAKVMVLEEKVKVEVHKLIGYIKSHLVGTNRVSSLPSLLRRSLFMG